MEAKREEDIKMYDEDDKIPREAAMEAVDFALYYLGKIKKSMDIRDVDNLISHMQDIRKQIERMK